MDKFNYSKAQPTGLLLQDYISLIGDEAVARIATKAGAMRGRTVQHINATKHGGGVAEILHSLIPLFNDVGIAARWDIIQGTPPFYDVTKAMHNFLQGKDGDFTEEEWKLYEDTNAGNAGVLEDCEVTLIHDPQPLPLVRERKPGQRWLWRCHIDLSTTNRAVWSRAQPYVDAYDGAVFSLPAYKQPVTPPIRYVKPAINPFHPKNVPMAPDQAEAVLDRYNIPHDKPIVTQVSRFDPWKDPVGVVTACNKARQQVDFTLVMLGNMADDDPEGKVIFDQVKELADENTIISAEGDDADLVNALQSYSDIIMQKSIREGFGLTVTEAMWKERPVIGGKVDGIGAQIEDGVNGFLVSSVDEAAQRVVELIGDQALRRRIGGAARESVRQNFLLSRLLEDHLDWLASVA
ncbi:MAG: glycosyltransferase [Hyphomicrobiales bacterium]|nr:glycosyltransferase [Hyphomicrobiales bacterium]MCP5374411.1 glycosyltransferase [Hyphomicrobiales bacterium]